MNKYILNGHTPLIEPDTIKWAQWFEKANRIIKSDIVLGSHISTVFLGLDHSFMGGPPMLFETMIFGGEQDSYQERYSTWDEAEKGHQEALELVFK